MENTESQKDVNNVNILSSVTGIGIEKIELTPTAVQLPFKRYYFHLSSFHLSDTIFIYSASI